MGRAPQYGRIREHEGGGRGGGRGGGVDEEKEKDFESKDSWNTVCSQKMDLNQCYGG